MQETTAKSPSASPTTTRLPLLADGRVDLVALGEIEQAVRTHQPLTAAEGATYEEALAHPHAAAMLSAAADAYAEHLGQVVREYGGTIVTERTRWENGRRVRTRHVQRFRGTRKVATHKRTATRARGAGRPKGQSARSSAKSGDSGEDGEPPGRTCACGCDLDISHRASQAKYLNDAHAASARQRRRRNRKRDWNPDVSPRDFISQAELEKLRRRIKGACRCNGSHILDETGVHCIKCGHDRGLDPGGRVYIRARSAEARRARTTEVFA